MPAAFERAGQRDPGRAGADDAEVVVEAATGLELAGVVDHRMPLAAGPPASAAVGLRSAKSRERVEGGICEGWRDAAAGTSRKLTPGAP